MNTVPGASNLIWWELCPVVFQKTNLEDRIRKVIENEHGSRRFQPVLMRTLPCKIRVKTSDFTPRSYNATWSESWSEIALEKRLLKLAGAGPWGCWRVIVVSLMLFRRSWLKLNYLCMTNQPLHDLDCQLCVTKYYLRWLVCYFVWLIDLCIDW